MKATLSPPSPQKKRLLNKQASLFLAQKQNKTSKLDPMVRQIYAREVAAYEKADVVLTITDDDKEKIFMTLDQEFDTLTQLIYNEQVHAEFFL